MFTGIVEEVGTVGSLEPREAGARIQIRCTTVLEGLKDGDSIAVNGACLTAVDHGSGYFAADVAPETLRATNLGDLRPGSLVNLERAMSASGRLHGHLVQGHVDATGELLSLEPLGNQNWWLRIRVPEEVERYLVYKGSIAIDGISLTIAALEGDVLSVTIIPHTYQNTSLRGLRPGARVNLEVDILAKYVHKMLSGMERPSGLTVDKLRENGY